MYGTWFNLPGFAMNSAIRADGNPKFASKMMIIACLFNLNTRPYIYIWILVWELKGQH